MRIKDSSSVVEPLTLSKLPEGAMFRLTGRNLSGKPCLLKGIKLTEYFIKLECCDENGENALWCECGRLVTVPDDALVEEYEVTATPVPRA
jgi:hypothetical protein